MAGKLAGPYALTPQEKRLIACAAKGEWWNPTWAGDEIILDYDPAYAYGWRENRTIRAEVFSALAAGEFWQGEEKVWPVSSKGLMVYRARISGDLDLEGATLRRTLWLRDCAFDAPAEFLDARTRTISFAGSHLPGLRMGRTIVDGDLYLNGGFTARGEVDLARADIKGLLDCGGGLFEKPDGTTLNAAAITVGGSVFLSNGFTAKGEVDLKGANIKGQLNCSRGMFEKPDGTALNADAITIGTYVILRDGFTAKGEVNFLRAEIKGQFICTGATFENRHGAALRVAASIVGADVFLGDGFTAKGEVNLVRAEIKGHFTCSGGTFENPGGTALNADASTVGGGLFLRHGFVAKGKVNLGSATIGANLDCRGGCFSTETRDALDMSLTKVGGALLLNGLRAPEGCDYGMAGRLLLPQASCRTYRDDPKSWPAPGQLVLDGFTYDRFDNCDTDCATRMRWLSLQPEEHRDGDFRPQPWIQAIKVLRDIGHDREARNLGIAFEKARAARKSTRWYWKFWHKITLWTVGCGYRPELAGLWSLGFVLAGWLVFASAANLGFIGPRDGSVIAYLAANPEKPLPEHYARFNALVYALDAYLPVIELGQDEAWEPANEPHGGVRLLAVDEDGWDCGSRLLLGQNASWLKAKSLPRSCGYPEDPRWHWLTGSLAWSFRHGLHRLVYWIVELAGWVLVSLYIAGMSGLMKKE